MRIDPKQAALTAINEAITALDFDTEPGLPSDDLTIEAMTILLEARSLYTGKPWPEFRLLPEEERAAWLEAKADDQRKDGRQ